MTRRRTVDNAPWGFSSLSLPMKRGPGVEPDYLLSSTVLPVHQSSRWILSVASDSDGETTQLILNSPPTPPIPPCAHLRAKLCSSPYCIEGIQPMALRSSPALGLYSATAKVFPSFSKFAVLYSELTRISCLSLRLSLARIGALYTTQSGPGSSMSYLFPQKALQHAAAGYC